MSKQSSIEWLVDYIKNLEKYPYKTIQELEEQAKAMHEMEIITAHFTAQPFNSTMLHNAEQYYNETFKK